MLSGNKRYAIVFNGEIYNFQELRAELIEQGVAFNGTSDTEVMLEGFGRWGVEETVKRLIGMFAVALWDREENVFGSSATASASNCSISALSANASYSARS